LQGAQLNLVFCFALNVLCLALANLYVCFMKPTLELSGSELQMPSPILSNQWKCISNAFVFRSGFIKIVIFFLNNGL